MSREGIIAWTAVTVVLVLCALGVGVVIGTIIER